MRKKRKLHEPAKVSLILEAFRGECQCRNAAPTCRAALNSSTGSATFIEDAYRRAVSGALAELGGAGGED